MQHERIYESPRRRRGKPPEPEPEFSKSLIQLLVCMVIMGVVLLVKTFSPGGGETVQAMIREHITAGLNAEEALETVGRAFSGELSFVDVWRQLTEEPEPVNADANEPPVVSSPSPTPSATEPPQISPALTSSGASGSSPAPSEAAFLSNTAGGESGKSLTPPLVLDELYFSWEEELGEDDTLPIPFGTELPSKASFAETVLPFDYVIPVNGEVTSVFGFREHPVDGEENTFHYGLDISGASGTDIRCFADGVVAASGNSTTYGKYIIVRHDGDFATLYAHCSKILATEGKAVKAGDVIARVGATGKVTGPHLHFEVREGGILLNPQQYLQLNVR